jgi:hypothetical protein
MNPIDKARILKKLESEWAGFIPEPSAILAHMKKENELRARW